ncbi:type IX secretion system sortase PorU, partial [Candidatus Latescibacterota bacterium]
MGRLSHIPLMVFVAFFLLTTPQVRGAVTLTESTPGGFRFTYQPGIAVTDTLRAGDHTYLAFSYDGHSSPSTPGAPQIPVETIYFAAPSGSEPRIEPTGTVTRTTQNTRVAPVPLMAADPTGLSVPIYAEDPAWYALSGYEPSHFVRVEQTDAGSNGITIWRMLLSPLLYDAYRNEIVQTEGFDVAVTFSGSFPPIGGVTLIPSYLINTETIRELAAKTPVQKRDARDESPFAEGDWYRMTVTDAGIYRVTCAELVQAGFPAGGVSADAIHVYYGGGHMLSETPHEPTTDAFREVAVKIIDGGDGVFDGSDSIIFRGEALSRFTTLPGATRPVFQNYLYADQGENVYWLTIRSDTPSKRMTLIGEPPSAGVEVVTTYQEVIHHEPENYIEYIDQFNSESGLHWYWETIASRTESFTFDTPGCVDPNSAILRLGFRNGMSIEQNASVKTYKSHTVNYSVNKAASKLLNINTIADSTVQQEISVDTAVMPQGNILELFRTPTALNPNANIRLDWLEVEYTRELKLVSQYCEFFHRGTGTPVQFVLGNAASSGVEVYDTSDPYDVREITSGQFDGLNHTLTFQITVGDGHFAHFTALAPAQYKTVSTISKKVPVNLRDPLNTADYIIITHENFSAEAQTLANWRARDSSVEPLATMVVDVADIYDEFSWGVYDPVAIRDFLYRAWHSYNQGTRPVSYCCLFGDTTFKFKNIQNQPEKNYLPSYTGTNNGGGFISDDFFSWFDTNYIPEIAIGRLCVADVQTARSIVTKTIAYERDTEPGLWHNRVLFVADDEYVFAGKVEAEGNFTANIEDIESNVPESFDRKKLLLIEYPMVNKKKPSVTEELFRDINDGYLIFNYIGHGNNDVLAHEDILRGSRDIEKFANGPRLPVVLTFSCTVGQFDKPGIKSLAESMHLRASGGSIASISPARFTFNSSNVDLNKRFYTYLFDYPGNPDKRIGKALLLAKQSVSNRGNALKYFLLGDPATRLMMPRQSITVAPVDTLPRLKKIDITGLIDEAETMTGTATVHVKAFGPKLHKVYQTQDVTITYTMPGNTFYQGELTTLEPQFAFSFIVPRDIDSDLALPLSYQKESKIIIYAEGDGTEAVGVINNFLISDIDSNAPEDTSGPEFTVKFDNKTFEPGDVIRRQPNLTIELTDPSGINIVGSRGHNIKLLLDRTESLVLTEHYLCRNGFTTGELTYPLPL